MLRRRLPVSLTGLSLADLIDMADEIGLAARPLRAEMDEIASIRLPAVLHWDLTHFVVLKAVKRTLSGPRYIVHDPARGIVRSEEHTSELQSLMRISYAVFCLKKKTKQKTTTNTIGLLK